MTGDLNTTFGHRPFILRGAFRHPERREMSDVRSCKGGTVRTESKDLAPHHHFAFLISHSTKVFIPERAPRPRANPPPKPQKGTCPHPSPLCLYFLLLFFFFFLSFLPFLCFLHFLTLAEMSLSSSGSVSSSPAGCISSSEISQSPSILSSPSGRPSVWVLY